MAYYLFTTAQENPFTYRWKIEDLQEKDFVEVEDFTVDEDWNEKYQTLWIATWMITKIYLGKEEDKE